MASVRFCGGLGNVKVLPVGRGVGLWAVRVRPSGRLRVRVVPLGLVGVEPWTVSVTGNVRPERVAAGEEEGEGVGEGVAPSAGVVLKFNTTLCGPWLGLGRASGRRAGVRFMGATVAATGQAGQRGQERGIEKAPLPPICPRH